MSSQEEGQLGGLDEAGLSDLPPPSFSSRARSVATSRESLLTLDQAMDMLRALEDQDVSEEDLRDGWRNVGASNLLRMRGNDFRMLHDKLGWEVKSVSKDALLPDVINWMSAGEVPVSNQLSEQRVDAELERANQQLTAEVQRLSAQVALNVSPEDVTPAQAMVNDWMSSGNRALAELGMQSGPQPHPVQSRNRMQPRLSGLSGHHQGLPS